MIEVQIKNQHLFDKWKSFSTYSSELTKVAEFPDGLFDELKQAGVIGDEVQLDEEQKPLIKIKGKTMAVENPTLEILTFLGNKMENDHEISIRYLDRVRMLIYANILDVDESFLNFYSYLDGSENLDKLMYGNKNYRRMPSLQKLMQEQNQEERDFKINESLLLDEKMIRSKDISYKTAVIKMTSNIEQNQNKGFHIEAVDKEGRNYYLSMFSRPNSIERMLLNKGTKTKIAFTSTKTTGTQIFISSFEFIPEDLEMSLVRIFYPRTRMISTEYFRILYDELRFRMELTENNKLTPRSNMKGQYALNGVFE